jgi:hypothetical protein
MCCYVPSLRVLRASRKLEGEDLVRPEAEVWPTLIKQVVHIDQGGTAALDYHPGWPMSNGGLNLRREKEVRPVLGALQEVLGPASPISVGLLLAGVGALLAGLGGFFRGVDHLVDAQVKLRARRAGERPK